MQEYYGIEIPEPSIRAITLEHAHCMQKESITSVQTCQDRMKSGNIDAVMAELDQHRNGKKGKAANSAAVYFFYMGSVNSYGDFSKRARQN